MIVRIEDLCQKCKHFNIGDNECNAGQFIDDIGMFTKEVVAECEDYRGE